MPVPAWRSYRWTLSRLVLYDLELAMAYKDMSQEHLVHTYGTRRARVKHPRCWYVRGVPAYVRFGPGSLRQAQTESAHVF